MLRAAVERKLEIIGEAFAKLENAEPAVTEKFPELRKIVGLRNRIIHGYDTVDEELVWDVVKNKLPALQQQGEALGPLNPLRCLTAHPGWGLQYLLPRTRSVWLC
jgi:uncharacterized protein with HEPN domain